MRRIFILLLIITTLLGACRSGANVEPESAPIPTESQSSEGQSAAELVDQGKAMLESDRCQAALVPLERAVELDPNLPDAYLALGNAYTRLGRGEEAVEAYESALKSDDQFAAAYTNLGAAYLRQIDPTAGNENAASQVQKAIDSFRTALDLEPEDPETHANLGMALVNASQIPQAKEEFEEALRLNPDLAEAHVGLGYIYLLTGQAQEAVRELEKATELAPDMPEAHYALGIAYAETNQLERAIGAFEALLAIEIPADCPGDVAAAAEPRAQAAETLEQLRSQQ